MTKSKQEENFEGRERCSIALRFIRHAESMNNQVYHQAHKRFKSGTPEFDFEGWNAYVEEHRVADPGLSDRGDRQAQALASYLVPNLQNQASNPVRFVVSPMQRTLETILPTLDALHQNGNDDSGSKKTRVIVNGLYTESEGCHLRGVTAPGKNQIEVAEMLPKSCHPLSFVGYTQNPHDGWYSHASGPETRFESEERAATFFVWLCEYLDKELLAKDDHEEDQTDVFDSGVVAEGEEEEDELDKLSPRLRKRRTVVLIGHGDFMSLVLKRVIASFGYGVETPNISHRAAFVHFNTGITDLEYYGAGRFLVMSQNHTPHLPTDHSLHSGGGLRDGWSYLMPHTKTFSNVKLCYYGNDDDIEEHVREQIDAMNRLYSHPLSVLTRIPFHPLSETNVEKDKPTPPMTLIRNISSSDNAAMTVNTTTNTNNEPTKITFVVKRGLQVVGCASLHKQEKTLTNVVIRPSAAVKDNTVGEALVHAIQRHIGSDGSVLVELQSACCHSEPFFQTLV